jgi:hypothetical protein
MRFVALINIPYLDNTGNLALSRAIGDFEFKQNKLLTAEEQIVTGTTRLPSTLRTLQRCI